MSKIFLLQTEFAVCVARLILYADSIGYRLTFGDAYRDQRVTYGHPQSVHKKRLAVDLNLFINGEYMQTEESHRRLGDFWKKLHPQARWGGDFDTERSPEKSDGNHYSFEWEGVK